jgi:chemotaxis protein methyltransferase CheR
MTPTASKEGPSRADYARFRDLVRETSGLEVPESRRPELERAVVRAREETGSPDAEGLYRLLTDRASGRPAMEALVATLTIGETHFFRNRPQFEALERHILPDLIARRRDVRRLRLWSAGCASGEEPYSLAILIHQLLPDLPDWNVSILGTDISRSALEKARQGVYGRWSFREVPPETQAGWFIERGGRFEVLPRVRDLVSFGYLNLVEDVYPSLSTNTNALDLILCRNVLMYFRPDTARGVVARLHGALADGGWLVVGHTEPSQEIFHGLEARNLPGTVVYRKPEPRDQEANAPGSEPKGRAAAVGDTPIDAPPRPSPDLPRARSVSAQRSPTLQRMPGPDRRAEAVSLIEAGRLDEARRKLEALAASHPDDPESPYVLAKVHANRLEFEAAERWIDVALSRAPLHAPSHYLRGLVLQERGRLDGALDAHRRCVYADPTFVLGHFALAGLFRQMGQPRRARKSLENVTRLLAGLERDQPVAEGDGLMVGRLLELVTVHRGFVDQDLSEEHGDGR